MKDQGTSKPGGPDHGTEREEGNDASRTQGNSPDQKSGQANQGGYQSGNKTGNQGGSQGGSQGGGYQGGNK